MAWVAMVVAAVGALVQGRQQANEARAAAKVEKYHAGIADQNAAIAGQQASAEQERVRREGRQVLGAQRAAMAQSGTGMGPGTSNFDIQRQSTTMAELDALNVQYAGDLERRGLMQQAQMHRYNESSLRAKAKSIMRQRWITAAGAAMSAYGGGMGGGGGGSSGGGGGYASGNPYKG